MKLLLAFLLLHLSEAQHDTGQCCGPGQSPADFDSADFPAVQSESDLTHTSDTWFRSPAIPLRQKALLMEPCIPGKVCSNSDMVISALVYPFILHTVLSN
jgi:hypothetical protein